MSSKNQVRRPVRQDQAGGQGRYKVPAERRPSNNVVRFFKTPKGIVLLLLVALTLLALLNKHQSHGVITILVAVVTASLVDFVVSLVQRSARPFSSGGVITALIVAGILSVTSPLYLVILTTVIATVSKHILKIKRKPFFNPAAFGLVVATLLFPVGQSWWISLPLLSPWFIPILLVSGFYVAKRVNKLPAVYSYLATYFVLLFVMALFHLGLPSDTPADALRSPFINSALFLALFMLTDPPTSPASLRHQVYFGLIAAGVGTLDFALQGGLAYLFIGLLAANLWKVWVSRKPKQVRERQSAVRVSNRRSSENWYV